VADPIEALVSSLRTRWPPGTSSTAPGSCRQAPSGKVHVRLVELRARRLARYARLGRASHGALPVARLESCRPPRPAPCRDAESGSFAPLPGYRRNRDKAGLSTRMRANRRWNRCSVARSVRGSGFSVGEMATAGVGDRCHWNRFQPSLPHSTITTLDTLVFPDNRSDPCGDPPRSPRRHNTKSSLLSRGVDTLMPGSEDQGRPRSSRHETIPCSARIRGEVAPLPPRVDSNVVAALPDRC